MLYNELISILIITRRYLGNRQKHAMGGDAFDRELSVFHASTRRAAVALA